MPTLDSLKNTIFNIRNRHDFEHAALEIFQIQVAGNPVYGAFVAELGLDSQNITNLEAIPFLPIQFFKTHEVKSGDWQPEVVFTSSGTTSSTTSSHQIKDISIYEQSFINGFRRFYGNPSEYCILALLPAYLERSGSSLVYMANDLVNESRHVQSGFYLHDYDSLISTLQNLAATKTPTLLLGVSFALLDVAEKLSNFQHPNLIVMETGGMKGRRKELIREELHLQLTKGFNVPVIHSEYGMTELLSQAYSKGNGIYQTPPWMQVMVRDTTDPLSSVKPGATGGLNIIDLANLNSCSFIATEDLGRTHADGSFEVLGRFDQSDIRGCNLMVL